MLLVLPGLARGGQWKGEAGVGLIATRGNSDTDSLNGKFLLDYTHQAWKNQFTVTAINSGDDDGRTAERYTAGDKLDYHLSELNYLFGAVDWERDRFGGYRERMSEVLGYGRHLLSGPVHRLDVEIGAGARQTEEQSTGEEHDEAIGRISGQYGWTLSDTSAFAQSLKIESGSSNTYSEAISELKISIVGSLFATLSFSVRHNSDVPVGTDKTDTVTAANLSYAFGGI